MPLVAASDQRRHWQDIVSSSCQTYSAYISWALLNLIQISYPLSRTKSDNHVLSLRLSNLLALSDMGSRSLKPSSESAFLASRQSAVATPSLGVCGSYDTGKMILFNDRSNAMVRAMESHVDVSSSAQCSPADSHGILTMKASTISTDL